MTGGDKAAQGGGGRRCRGGGEGRDGKWAGEVRMRGGESVESLLAGDGTAATGREGS